MPTTFVDRIIKCSADGFRNFMSRKMFSVIKAHCQGDVLDVGGWSFFSYVQGLGLQYTKWNCLEYNKDNICRNNASGYTLTIGDGCELPFQTGTFDTILNIQVLEHVFEPIRMFDEIVRSLKPGGKVLLVVPQTAAIHALPHCYQNFTIYWVRTAASKFGLEIIEEHALGGAWSTIMFRMIYFFLQAFRVPSFSSPEFKRGKAFYVLIPFMCIYALMSIPVCALFSLGDLSEEPNNHLAVLRKPL